MSNDMPPIMDRYQEQRHHDRLPFNAPMFLCKRGQRHFGEVENISQNGMFVSVSGKHLPGEYAEVSIYLLRGFAALSLTIPGRIVRQGNDGIGFQSDHIDPSSLLCYASLLNLHRKDTPQLMEEVLDYGTSLPINQNC